MKKNILLKILIILNIVISVGILTYIMADTLFQDVTSIESIALISVIILVLTAVLSKFFFYLIYKNDDSKKDFEVDNLFN